MALADQCSWNTAIISRIHIEDSSDLDCVFVQDLQAIFQNLQTSLQISVPPIELKLKARSDNASFDEQSTLTVPYQLVFYGTYGNSVTKYRWDSYVVASHEYGHYLFAQLIKQLMRQQRKQFDFAKYRTALIPYSEFFADVISVLYFKDKEAVFKALYYDQVSDQQFEELQYRSFAMKYADVDRLNLWSVHSRLALARSWVGEHLWETLQKEPSKTIETLVRVLIPQIQEEFRSPKEDFLEQNSLLILNLEASYR